MPNRYTVAGLSADTAATADHVGALLWNPAANKALELRELHWQQTTAHTNYVGLVRATTAGATPGTTVTPDVDHAYHRRAAPSSGALLYLGAFGTQPAVAGSYMFRANTGSEPGIGASWLFHDKPLKILAGTGLAVVTTAALILRASIFVFAWDE